MNDPTPTALNFFYISDVTGTPTSPGDFEYEAFLPEPFNATAAIKYWIAIQAKSDWPPQWAWRTNGDNPDQLHLPVRGFPLVDVPYWTEVTSEEGDMAFYLIGSNYPPPPPPKPDLDCNGQLSWTDIKPRVRVTGSFQVMNIGEPNSQLNWTIVSYPDWGTWTFTPSSGTNLTPEDGPVTVTVEVIAPPDKEKSFNGTVRVVNTDNASDFCDIPVTLTTPLAQGIHGSSFFERFFTRFPHALPILHYVLGYVCN